MTFTCNDVDKKVRMITNLHLLMRIYNDLSWIEFHLAISAEDSCAKFSLLACFYIKVLKEAVHYKVKVIVSVFGYKHFVICR